MNNYEIAAAAYGVVVLCFLYGSLMFVRRGEHPRTALSLVLTWFFMRAALVNWGRGGHHMLTWLAGDQATVMTAITLAASSVMFIAAEREKAT